VSVLSLAVGGAFVAFGVVMIIRSLGGLTAGSGQTRARLIISQPRGHRVRLAVITISVGSLFLVSGATANPYWWWPFGAVWAALVMWDTLIWLKARQRRAHT
jgi:hypothetical protein